MLSFLACSVNSVCMAVIILKQPTTANGKKRSVSRHSTMPAHVVLGCGYCDTARACSFHLHSSTPRISNHKILTKALNSPIGATIMNARYPSGG